MLKILFYRRYSQLRLFSMYEIADHFTVLSLVTWPLNGSEAGGDLVLVKTLLLLMCQSSCFNANKGIYMTKAERSVLKQGHLQPRCLGI